MKKHIRFKIFILHSARTPFVGDKMIEIKLLSDFQLESPDCCIWLK